MKYRQMQNNEKKKIGDIVIYKSPINRDLNGEGAVQDIRPVPEDDRNWGSAQYKINGTWMPSYYIQIADTPPPSHTEIVWKNAWEAHQHLYWCWEAFGEEHRNIRIPLHNKTLKEITLGDFYNKERGFLKDASIPVAYYDWFKRGNRLDERLTVRDLGLRYVVELDGLPRYFAPDEEDAYRIKRELVAIPPPNGQGKMLQGIFIPLNFRD